MLYRNLAISLCLLGAPAALADQTIPADVQAIDAAWNLMQEEERSQDSMTAIAEIMWDRAAAVARESGSFEAMRIDSAEFRGFISRKVSNISSGNFASDRGRLALLRKTTSRRLANVILGEWLGSASAGFLSTDSGESPRPPISSQVEFAGSTGGLTLSDAGVTLMADEGGPGAGNGVIDAGEWIHIGAEVMNTTDVPWYSTSVWPESGSSCVWVAPSDEFVMNEMAPRGGTSPVQAWAYVSSQCGNNARVVFSMRDSLREGGAEQRVRVNLHPVGFSGLSLSDIKFEADIPGSSDGSEDVLVVPNGEYEISANVVAATSMTAASSTFMIPEALSPLFSAQQHTVEPLTSLGRGEFEAYDDFDVTAVTRTPYLDSIGTHRAVEDNLEKWLGINASVMWVAVDTEVSSVQSFETPGQDEQAANSTVVTSSAPAELPRVPARVVGELIRQTVSLAPRPAPVVTDGALEASDGYEVVIDADTFMAAYSAYGRTEAAAPAPASTPEVAMSSSSVFYRYLNYIPIPLTPPLPVLSGCMDRDATNFLATATDDDGSCTYPPAATGCTKFWAINYDRDAEEDDGSCQRADFRVDLMAGLGLVGTADEEYWATASSTVSRKAGALALTYAHPSFRVGLEMSRTGSVADLQFQGDDEWSFSHNSLLFGRGFGLMSGALDLEVMGSVGTFSVTQTRSGSSEKASNFSPGLRVQAIYGVTEQIGVLLGLRQHYLVDGGSLMGNTHTGLNLGASYYF